MLFLNGCQQERLYIEAPLHSHRLVERPPYNSRVTRPESRGASLGRATAPTFGISSLWTQIYCQNNHKLVHFISRVTLTKFGSRHGLSWAKKKLVSTQTSLYFRLMRLFGHVAHGVSPPARAMPYSRRQEQQHLRALF